MNTQDQIYPLLSIPLLKSKIWGGRKLEKLFGLELPGNEKIGEAWLVADLREGTSFIGNGPLKDRSLTDISKSWGEKLIGSGWRNSSTGDRFPLLIKFIDAEDDLSIQVHPDRESCKRYFPDDFSKDETWIILDSEPGGRILHGFRPGMTITRFDQLLANGKIEDCLRSVEVSAGDVIRVAPGTVHALCKGVSVLEIQEPSDSTFRIYDYNRAGDDGTPRPLHIEESRKVIRFGDPSPPKLEPQTTHTDWGRHELLIDVPAYRIERIGVNKKVSWTVPPLSFQVLILIQGNINLSTETMNLEIQKGQSVIIPASMKKISLNPKSGFAIAVLTGAGGIEMIQPGIT